MFKVVVLVSLAASALGAVPRPNGRIVGGQDADIKDYPYQLSLLHSNQHDCGASILSSKWAVTAAHCTHGLSADGFQVRVGSSTLSGGQLVQVKKIYIHNSYNPDIADFDISLLELKSDITLGPAAGIITPADEDTIYQEGDNATVTGWGTTSEHGGLSQQLQVVTVPYVPNGICATKYENISPVTDRMLCAGYNDGGKDACSGDSGGPLVINGKLAGIVSWGKGCAEKGFPGVYTNVPALRGYIKDITGI